MLSHSRISHGLVLIVDPRQRLVITVPAATVAPLPYFPVVLTAASLPTELTNNTYGRSDGGDLAFAAGLGTGNSVASIGAQIPCEVVSAVFGVTPSAEIHVQVPSVAATGTLTYIWVLYGNSGQTAQPAVGSTYGSQAVWNEGGTQNFSGVWHLNQAGTNPQVLDSTANANNSSAQVWTPTSSGAFGSGGVFSSSTYISIPTSTSLQSNHVTLGAWFNLASSGYRTLLGVPANTAPWTSPYASTLLRINATTQFEADVSIGSVHDALTATVSAFSLSTWHHACMTFDGSNISFYLDGAHISDAAYAGVISYSGTSPLVIGADYSASPYGDHFNGTLDEARTSVLARSGSWIAAEFANQSVPGTFIAPPTGQGPLSLLTSFMPWIFNTEDI